MPDLISQGHQRQLITWAWRHLKRDSPLVVSYAMLTTSRYMTTVVSPENIVTQVRSYAVYVGYAHGRYEALGGL